MNVAHNIKDCMQQDEYFMNVLLYKKNTQIASINVKKNMCCVRTHEKRVRLALDEVDTYINGLIQTDPYIQWTVKKIY